MPGASGLERQEEADAASMHRGGGGEAAAIPDDLASPLHQIQAVSSKLRGVTFSLFYTLLREYWYFTE